MIFIYKTSCNKKEVLTINIGDKESAKYGLSVRNGLTGIREAAAREQPEHGVSQSPIKMIKQKDLIYMITGKKQQMTAIMVLSSIVLILLLSLNFRIWSGSYMDGDLESAVIQQMNHLEQSESESDRNEGIFFHFYEWICFVGIEIMVLGAYEWFKELRQGEFSFRPGVTLRSLSVRMDH